MIDWLQTFINRFKHDRDVNNIKSNKIHGSLTINFHEGNPVNCDLKKHIRAKVENTEYKDVVAGSPTFHKKQY